MNIAVKQDDFFHKKVEHYNNSNMIAIQFHREQIFSRHGVLDTLYEALYMADSFHIWVPCICDEPGARAVAEYDEDSCTLLNAPRRIPQFFRQWRWNNWDKNYDLEKFDFDSQTFFLRNGKSWVERAYSENKPCLVRDVSRRSISDYPFSG